MLCTRRGDRQTSKNCPDPSPISTRIRTCGRNCRSSLHPGFTRCSLDDVVVGMVKMMTMSSTQSGSTALLVGKHSGKGDNLPFHGFRPPPEGDAAVPRAGHGRHRARARPATAVTSQRRLVSCSSPRCFFSLCVKSVIAKDCSVTLARQTSGYAFHLTTFL